MDIFETLRFQFSRLKNFIFHPPKEIWGNEPPKLLDRKMENSINLWYEMFNDEPPWETRRVQSIGIPAAICRELANPVFLEFNANITGGVRGEYLLECFQTAQEGFKTALESGLALGSVTFKPYPHEGRILVDAVGPTAFSPTKFDEAGVCTGGVFKSKPIQKNGQWYVKIEHHELDGTRYTIRNSAYLSDQNGNTGAAVPLSKVEEWAGIEPETVIEPVRGPLFSYFKPPISNNIDVSSNVGVSVYGGSTVGLIKQADEQWERMTWEFRSGMRKIFMDSTETRAKDFDKDLFELGMFSIDGKNFFEVFSPEFRDEPLYRGFQSILKQIEFRVGLAYGTLSDPQTVDKTATEIRNSKQRMYITVDGIQKALTHVFDRLIYAMDVYTSLFNLAPEGDYEVSYEWGDSILNDEETRRIDNQDMRADVAANLIRPELYIMKKYGVTEEDALAMMPAVEEMVDEEQDEVE